MRLLHLTRLQGQGEQGRHHVGLSDDAHQLHPLHHRHVVQTARRYQPLYDLVEAFSDGGLHHMPVVEGEQLVGIITQSDMVAALFTLALKPGLTSEEATPVSS